MPKRNIRGGKGFKKGRKEDPTKELAMKFEGKEVGQQYARIVTALGNRRFKCFCDDGVERICKVRGVLCWGPKRQKMEVGDIVLISARNFDTPDSDEEDGGGVGTPESSSRVDISDIITKIPQRFWRDVRREAGIHPDLFGGVAPSAFEFDDKKSRKSAARDDIFDDESDGGEEDGDGDGESEEGEAAAATTIQHVRGLGGKARAPKWAVAARDSRDDDSGNESADVDVDAI